MEFLEFMKQKERMCSTCNCNEDCPMYRGKNAVPCNDFIRYHPKEAEKIVEKWAKEHRIITNRQKFIDVFGEHSFLYHGNRLCIRKPDMDVFNTEFKEWLNKEYQPPKGE